MVILFNHLMHEPPTGYKGDHYYDAETGDNYYRISSEKYRLVKADGTEGYFSRIAEVDVTNKDLIRNVSNAKRLSAIGDTITTLGYGLTLTGFGAKIGIPMIAIGNGIGFTASAWEIGAHYLYNKNLKKRSIEIMKVASFDVAGFFVPKYGAKWLGKRYGSIISKQNMRIMEEGLGVKISILSYAF